MDSKISNKDIVIIGLMLFALFFGAGNLVFPVMLGQLAGTEVWVAMIGFLLTGVGLPLLGVIALSISGKPDLLSLASRVHPIYGVIFTTTLYLTIGPLFAMPRTASVSYEIALNTFVDQKYDTVILLIFSVLFFALTCFLSLNPSKMIDIVGKWLTPLLIAFIVILSVVALINPLGSPMEPQGKYQADALFHGFQEGYLTMDALAAFVFGIIVINAIKEKGAQSGKTLLVTGIKASVLSAVILALIYAALAYIGATSVESLGYFKNGGEVLTSISFHYFNTFGGLFLGLIVLLACLTTSIGLTTACATYLHKLMPRLSYKVYAVLLCIVSGLLANVGLTELIEISVPVLTTIYPLAIVLMILTFAHKLFRGKQSVYWFSLALTFLVSIVEGIDNSAWKIQWLHDFYSEYVPMYDIGLGWLIPAAVGIFIGLVWPSRRRSN